MASSGSEEGDWGWGHDDLYHQFPGVCSSNISGARRWCRRFGEGYPPRWDQSSLIAQFGCPSSGSESGVEGGQGTGGGGSSGSTSSATTAPTRASSTSVEPLSSTSSPSLSSSGSSVSMPPDFSDEEKEMSLLEIWRKRLAMLESDEGANPIGVVVEKRTESAKKILGVEDEEKPGVLKNDQAPLKDRGATHVSMETPVERAMNDLSIAGQQSEIKPGYLRLKPRKDHPGVMEYHVKITPHVSSFKLRKSLLATEESIAVLGGNKHYDGETLLLPSYLPHDVTYVTSFKKDQSTLYKVSVTFTRVRSVPKCEEFFSYLLSCNLRRLKYKDIDGRFCDVSMRLALVEHRVEVWPGISLTTVKINDDEMMVEVRPSNVFVGQDTVLDYLKSQFKGMPVGMKSKFDDFICSTKVVTKYNYKCHLINHVAWDITPESRFWRNGQVISFKEYLKRMHEVTITNVDSPMLISIGKHPDDDLGIRYVTLAPECCVITGLTDILVANEKLMADLSESVKSLIPQQAGNVNNFFNRILGDESVAEWFDIWGLHLERTVQ